jgi:hypothetical protein
MNKTKIIKEFEKKAGFIICYWCSKTIKSGERIIFKRELHSPYKLVTVGASCMSCFDRYNKKMKNIPTQMKGGKKK